MRTLARRFFNRQAVRRPLSVIVLALIDAVALAFGVLVPAGIRKP